MSSQKMKFVQKFAHTAQLRLSNAGDVSENRLETIIIVLFWSIDIAAAIADALSDTILLGLIMPIKHSGCVNYQLSYGYLE
jgi:hypothetical protein